MCMNRQQCLLESRYHQRVPNARSRFTTSRFIVCGRPSLTPRFLAKLQGNAAQVRRNVPGVLGWRPIVIWECELERIEKLRRRIARHFNEAFWPQMPVLTSPARPSTSMGVCSWWIRKDSAGRIWGRAEACGPGARALGLTILKEASEILAPPKRLGSIRVPSGGDSPRAPAMQAGAL